MKLLSTVISFLTIFYALSQAAAGEIVISDEIKTKINNEAVKEKKIIRLDRQKKDENKLFFRTWVSGSFDLDESTKRVSKRFDRISYGQEISSEKISLPAERLKIKTIKKRTKWWYFWKKPRVFNTPALQTDKVKKLDLEKPIQVLYREGSAYFKYIKFKEDKTKVALEHSKAIGLTKQFLLKNLFLSETDKDKIGPVFVEKRRINKDGGEGKKPYDYLVQQDVVFSRQYEGKPVINSKVVIGLLPSTKEIVLFKHLNWTPVQEKKVKKFSRSKLKKIGLNSGAAIEDRLKKKIQKISGNFTKAQIKEVIPAWFQAEDTLIPILAFNIYMEYPTKEGVWKRDYWEFINLTGSDDLFFKMDKQPQKPVKTP